MSGDRAVRPLPAPAARPLARSPPPARQTALPLAPNRSARDGRYAATLVRPQGMGQCTIRRSTCWTLRRLSCALRWAGALCSCGCAGRCTTCQPAPWGRCLFEDAAGNPSKCERDAARQVWRNVQAVSRLRFAALQHQPTRVLAFDAPAPPLMPCSPSALPKHMLTPSRSRASL